MALKFGGSIVLVLILSCAYSYAAESKQNLDAEATQILNSRCVSCHSLGGEAYGKFGNILNFRTLVDYKMIVPGKSDRSSLIEQVEWGLMPKKGTITSSEVDTLKAWIDSFDSKKHDVLPCASEEDELDFVFRDIEKGRARPSEVRNFRYISLARAFNSEAERKQKLNALLKILNSLSWQNQLASVESLQKTKSVVRIDLRDLGWSDLLWEKIQTENPASANQPTHRKNAEIESALGTKRPLISADWLIANAVKPPLYHLILGLPKTLKELEFNLGVDVGNNILQGAALRSGIRNSGVSRNNRIVERHRSRFGAYWRSYDFSNNVGRQNIFIEPLDFTPAGGEVIFHLPNGMLGFMLADGVGRRIDKAPVNIVSDSYRPDHSVENGVSCMRCHSNGFLDAKDQVLDHFLSALRDSFSDKDKLAVTSMYVPVADFRKAMDNDNKTYRAALAALQVDGNDPAVTEIGAGFEQDTSLKAAACELGVEERRLSNAIANAGSGNALAGLSRFSLGQVVPRDVFQESLPYLLPKIPYRRQEDPSPAPVSQFRKPPEERQRPAMREVSTVVNYSPRVRPSRNASNEQWMKYLYGVAP